MANKAMLLRGAALALAILCASCGHSPAEALHARYEDQNDISEFLVCSEYGCAKKQWVSLDEAEWNQVQSSFLPASTNTAEERERIRKAVALIENFVGPKAGTDIDRASATILTSDKLRQLDCIDEAYNTTTYLCLMAADDLIRFHDIGEPAAVATL